MEKEIIFVTHNMGKIKSAERCFENLKFKTFNYEIHPFLSDFIHSGNLFFTKKYTSSPQTRILPFSGLGRDDLAACK